MILPPEPVVVEADSQNLLEWPNRPFWLPSSEDPLNFGKILEGVESAVINHNLMQVSYDNGSLQTILLDEDNLSSGFREVSPIRFRWKSILKHWTLPRFFWMLKAMSTWKFLKVQGFFKIAPC